VAFHPSAPYLATGSSDNTAKLWLLNADCSAATCVSTLEKNGPSVAFHQFSGTLATGGADGTVKLYKKD
jgi:WD40 repeat protein